MYNQNNLNVASLANKNALKPILATVLFDKNKTVATDNFQLLEMSTIEEVEGMEKPICVEARAVQNIKGVLSAETIKTLPRRDEEFPNYRQIVPQGTPLFSESYNVDYLIQGLTVLKKMKNKFGMVTLSYHGENKPLVITATNPESKQKAMYIIMPLNK